MSRPKSVSKSTVEPESDEKKSEKKSESNCPQCTKVVKEMDMALCCEICEEWFHIKCEGLSEAEYKFMGEHKSIHWFCTPCNKNVSKVFKMFSTLKSKQDKLDEEVNRIGMAMATMGTDVQELKKEHSDIKIRIDTKLKQELTEEVLIEVDKRISLYAGKVKSEIGCISQEVLALKDNFTAMDTKLETAIEAKLVENIVKSANVIRKELEPSWATVVAKELDSKFEKMEKVSADVSSVQKTLEEVKSKAEEEKDKENRSMNIIIYRIQEMDTREETMKTDKAYCTQLFNEVLGVECQDSDVKHMFRLGKPGQTPRPLLVQFRDKSVKNRIMESLFKLREAENKFKNISVTHDLTRTEREECKTMVEEAKKKQTEEQGEFLWRVRGHPGQLKLIKIRKH
jgi:flagellin-like hook-associated protein FlgL